VNTQDVAFVESVRACALAGLVATSLVGGSADPGIFFFIALAVIVVADLRFREIAADYKAQMLLHRRQKTMALS
jgi:hypothetical protein